MNFNINQNNIRFCLIFALALQINFIFNIV
jgi:hypothetical protein